MGTHNISSSHFLTNWCDRINPYWKLALVFKCLTDNIMLDDFKSVLQRLGAMKLGGTTAMLPNSMNMMPSEKEGSADHVEEEEYIESSSRLRRDRASRHLGGVIDHDNALDDSGPGDGNRRMVANGIGKLGIKIHRLPSIDGGIFPVSKPSRPD
jgi:hypothetical protein